MSGPCSESNGSSNGVGADSIHQKSDVCGEFGVINKTSVASKQRKFHFKPVAANASIKNLYDVVSRFSHAKWELVRQTGFGGLLEFPPLRQIKRRFVLWVMSRIDYMDQSIVLDGDIRLKLDKYDVNRVFGIPACGLKVAANCKSQDEVGRKVMEWFIGTPLQEHQSIRAVQDLIEYEHAEPMSTQAANAFKIAFVIYVVSTLLAPGAKYDYPSVDYWDALIDPDSIDKFDWADYVIRKLFVSVIKLETDLKVSSKVPTVTGCCLFPQGSSTPGCSGSVVHRVRGGSPETWLAVQKLLEVVQPPVVDEVTGLPLILCPKCKDLRLTAFTCKWTENRGKRYFKCPRNNDVVIDVVLSWTKISMNGTLQSKNKDQRSCPWRLVVFLVAMFVVSISLNK